MKQTEIRIPDEWEGIDAQLEGASEYFKPELNTPYRLVFASAKPAPPDDRFKDRDGKPKVRMVITLKTLNGQPSNLIWTTGAFAVMREVRTAQKAGNLDRIEFLLKKKEEDGRTRYVFERIGQTSPSSKAEAFI